MGEKSPNFLKSSQKPNNYKMSHQPLFKPLNTNNNTCFETAYFGKN